MKNINTVGRVILSLLVCLLTIGAGRITDAEELRFKFKKGAKFKITIQQDVATKQSVGGFDSETPMKMVMNISWEIEDVKQDSFQIAQTVDRMQMSLTAPVIGEIKFDSNSDANEGMAKDMATAIKPLIGVKIVQDMDSRGQVSNVKIPEQAIKDIASNPLLKQMFSEDSLKQMFGQASLVLPEKAVQKGDTWNHAMQVKSPIGVMKLDNEYRYDGKAKQQGMHRLLVKTETAIEAADAPLGVKIKIKEQETSGVILFDSQAGHLSSSEVKQKMVMAISVQGQEINQTITSNTKMTFDPAQKD